MPARACAGVSLTELHSGGAAWGGTRTGQPLPRACYRRTTAPNANAVRAGVTCRATPRENHIRRTRAAPRPERQRTRVARGHHEEVVRQKVERMRLDVRLAAVNLNAALVVDIDVLFLRRRKELLVMEDADVAHGLADLRLARGVHAGPVEEREVALPAAERHVAAAAREGEAVGAEGGQGQVKGLARCA